VLGGAHHRTIWAPIRTGSTHIEAARIWRSARLSILADPGRETVKSAELARSRLEVIVLQSQYR